nr:HNH endonuclease signature motif containing protein [Rhodococcus sp. (in: high G+C Gram-positive bacteria)]
MQKLGDYRSADALSDQEVVSAIVEICHTENTLAADKYALLAQFSRRGLNLAQGHSSPAHWLAAGTRIAVGNGEKQFDVSAWLTGWPTVHAALSAGDIHIAHVREIHDGYWTVKTADSTITAERMHDVVRLLLDAALVGTVHTVKVETQTLAVMAAREARARHDAQVREQQRREQERRDWEERRRRRGQPNDPPVPDDQAEHPGDPKPADLKIGPPPVPVSENVALNKLEMFLLANGRTSLKGDIDTVLAEKLRATLTPLAKPHPEPDGTRDSRSHARRLSDALSQMLDRNSQRGRSGGSGGASAAVNVTVRLSDLLVTRPGDGAQNGRDQNGRDQNGSGRSSGPERGDPDWPFHLDWTHAISTSLARLLACDADLTPFIVDEHDVPLAMGRTVRLATPEQRRAVTLRDRCCVMCGRAADWCQIHHIVYWEDGGNTDITNLALVCTACHRRIHNEGWDIALGGDGHPTVIPPASEDPQRQPRPSYHRRRKPAA